MNKLNEANKQLVSENIRATDIQLILHEKQIFEKELNDLFNKKGYNKKQYLLEFQHTIDSYTKIVTPQKKVNFVYNIIRQIKDLHLSELVDYLSKYNSRLLTIQHQLQHKKVLNIIITSLPYELKRFLTDFYSRKNIGDVISYENKVNEYHQITKDFTRLVVYSNLLRELIIKAPVDILENHPDY